MSALRGGTGESALWHAACISFDQYRPRGNRFGADRRGSRRTPRICPVHRDLCSCCNRASAPDFATDNGRRSGLDDEKRHVAGLGVLAVVVLITWRYHDRLRHPQCSGRPVIRRFRDCNVSITGCAAVTEWRRMVRRQRSGNGYAAGRQRTLPDRQRGAGGLTSLTTDRFEPHEAERRLATGTIRDLPGLRPELPPPRWRRSSVRFRTGLECQESCIRL